MSEGEQLSEGEGLVDRAGLDVDGSVALVRVRRGHGSGGWTDAEVVRDWNVLAVDDHAQVGTDRPVESCPVPHPVKPPPSTRATRIVVLMVALRRAGRTLQPASPTRISMISNAMIQDLEPAIPRPPRAWKRDSACSAGARPDSYG